MDALFNEQEFHNSGECRDFRIAGLPGAAIHELLGQAVLRHSVEVSITMQVACGTASSASAACAMLKLPSAYAPRPTSSDAADRQGRLGGMLRPGQDVAPREDAVGHFDGKLLGSFRRADISSGRVAARPAPVVPRASSAV